MTTLPFEVIIYHVAAGDNGGTGGCGGMADAQDSKSCVGDYVWVQVPSSAVADLCLTEIQ